MYKFKEGVNDTQPMEKAVTYGIKNLSDRELLSILLGNGNKDESSDKLSFKVLLAIDKNKDNNDLVPDLMKIKGIGKSKAMMISSALEFSRRKLSTGKKKVSFPTDILPEVRHFVTRDQEYFIAVYLNGAHEIIETNLVTMGTLNRTLIHPREVFSDAVKNRCASVIVCHNHPSGNLEPSSEDIDVTKRLIEAGELLGIKILDHVIFSDKNYYSFVENNKI